MIRMKSHPTSQLRPSPSRTLKGVARLRRQRLTLATVLVALAAMPCPAHACSVCFGNAQSPLVQGAAAGVIFLGIVVYAVLMGFGGLTLMCFLRARKLRRAEEAGDPGEA